jgi:hypothetical protein
MSRPSPVVLYLSLVFASGIAVGGFGHWLFRAGTVEADLKQPRRSPDRSSEEFRRRLIEEMQARLGLSADQVVKINAILDDSRAKFREISARFEPEMKAIREQQIERTRAILSDEQKIEYEKFLAERKAEREKTRKQKGGHGPGRGPGPGGC